MAGQSLTNFTLLKSQLLACNSTYVGFLYAGAIVLINKPSTDGICQSKAWWKA